MSFVLSQSKKDQFFIRLVLILIDFIGVNIYIYKGDFVNKCGDKIYGDTDCERIFLRYNPTPFIFT